MTTPKPKTNTKRAVLTMVAGNGSQDIIKLRRDATLFGRDKGDVVINDSEVSATHCQIQNIDDIYHLFDMNSTNGTYVNNERVVKAKLKEGDIITIGQTSFKFGFEEEANIRHITTIFKTGGKNTQDQRSVVDTLIESELRSTQIFSILLDIRYGDGNSEKISLKQRSLFIGRASSFGKFDQDPELSRKHLLVKINDAGELFIEDLGSTNGSFLNGKKISGLHPIKSKDEVRIGTCILKISVQRA